MFKLCLKVVFEKKLDYVSNILEETFPDWQDVEVFTFETLEKSFIAPEIETRHTYHCIKNKNGTIF